MLYNMLTPFQKGVASFIGGGIMKLWNTHRVMFAMP